MSIAGLVLVVIALLFTGYVLAQRSQRQVQRLRAQGMYPQAGQETDHDVDRLLQHGHKIEAIKVYRATHGVGLKEAKDAVEKRQQTLGLH